LKKVLQWKLRSLVTALTKDKPISEVIDGVPFDKRFDRMLKRFDDFSAPPFTLQRLCELLLTPVPYASEPRKYVFAVEKLIYVSSTLPVLSPDEYNKTTAELEKALQAAAEQARVAAQATAAAIANAAANGTTPRARPPADFDA
jgi:hypothetical protein